MAKSFFLTDADSCIMYQYEMLSWLLPHLTYAAAAFLAGWLFYRSKLKKPLHILSDATDRIANSDLDFVIDYDKEDELGKLCAAFEKMRFSLDCNNREMWRQMEERKRLNASFSHDLRTPLTVLEGHLNILQKYAMSGKLSVEDITEIFSVMEIQLNRLKRYVSSMNELQRLEDIQVSLKPMNTEELIKSLKNTADIICASKNLSLRNEIKDESVRIDMEIVMQVFENLLSNAVRYARTSIEVQCKRKGKFLVISVSDDGDGFDPGTIKLATDPFYTTEKKSDGQHFGLGLNISKILCQRHNGSISLENLKSGGASVTVNFGMN